MWQLMRHRGSVLKTRIIKLGDDRAKEDQAEEDQPAPDRATENPAREVQAEEEYKYDRAREG